LLLCGKKSQVRTENVRWKPDEKNISESKAGALFIYKYTPASEKVKRACLVPLGLSMSNPCMAFSARKTAKTALFSGKTRFFSDFSLHFAEKVI